MTEQKDPNGIGAHDGGAKLDAGKNRISLLFMQYFPNAIDAITSISEFGARKYSPGGWKKVPDGYQRYTDAMARHYLADCKGEIFDDETNLPHDFQLAWNALARIECAMLKDKYGMKLSKPDAEAFVEAFIDIAEVSAGNEVVDAFNPDAGAYIDVNGVLWMPVKDKNDKGRKTITPDQSKAIKSGLAANKVLHNKKHSKKEKTKNGKSLSTS